MNAAVIRDVAAWEALDSRGRPTVGCVVRLESGRTGRVIVPSGASTGQYEAHELRDGGHRYGGFGVRAAVASVNNTLAKIARGMDAGRRVDLDRAMEDADGSAELSNLGANAVLAVSLAVTVAAAAERSEELWQALSGTDGPLLPMPMVNIISGGAHAGRSIDIQDVLVVPLNAANFAEAIEWVARVRGETARLLADMGGSATLVADEGGLASALTSNEAALELVTAGIERAGFEPGSDVVIAIDIAANQLWNGSAYTLAVEDRTLDSAAWIDTLAAWCDRYPIVSIEDPLSDDDWAGWAEATSRLGAGRQVLGDDLFATNAQRLQRGIGESVANAVLVKPNQAGTVSRAEDVVRRAHANGYAVVVSARSGDTEDFWLADLAVGWSAGQIKVGSTMRSERTAKWNRLLEIEALAGGSARFAGRSALAAGSPAAAEPDVSVSAVAQK